MTIGITDKLSLLSNIPSLQTSLTGVNDSKAGEIFAHQLQQAIDSGITAPNQTANRAEAIAQTLKLQMLQSTLTLSGDSGDSFSNQNGCFSSIQSSIQTLLASYRANLPQQTTDYAEPSAQVKNASKSQLQELSESAPAQNSAKAASSMGWLDPIVTAASQRYGVDTGLIKAIIKAESDGNPQAVSHAGAQGLMQLMPGTARSLGVKDSFDPEQNVMGGTRFLRDMLKRYDGNLDSALAAYNWGPGNVDKRPDALPRETRNYQSRVKQLYSAYSA